MSNIRFLCVFAVLVLAGCSVSTGNAGDASQLYKKVLPGSVEVFVEGRMALSGACVSPDGYVITAAHGITTPDQKLEVIFHGIGRMDSKLVGVDKGHDLALLKVESEKKLPFLKLAKENPRIGTPIFTVASPLNRHSLLLHARIAGDRVEYEWLDESKGFAGIIYLAGMSPRGSSGGAWVDDQGRIIGVQSGWLNEMTGGNSGIAFVAPISSVKKLIKEKTHAQSTTLGGKVEELWTQAPGYQQRFPEGTKGLAVFMVLDEGPLAKAGVEKDMVITKLEGEQVIYRSDFYETLRGKKSGDKVKLSVIEPDKQEELEVEVTLGSLEKVWLDATK